jgi:hypothetical protein
MKSDTSKMYVGFHGTLSYLLASVTYRSSVTGAGFRCRMVDARIEYMDAIKSCCCLNRAEKITVSNLLKTQLWFAGKIALIQIREYKR